MRDILVTIIICVMVVGSMIIVDSKERPTTIRETSSNYYEIVCMDGKEFIKGYYSLSINLDFDGKPIRCEEK